MNFIIILLTCIASLYFLIQFIWLRKFEHMQTLSKTELNNHPDKDFYDRWKKQMENKSK